MISRIEFYIVICFISAIFLFSIFYTSDTEVITERIRIEARDSIYQVQRDSALTLSLKYELKADSLQAIINRKNLDINNIKKKYENEKKNVLILCADSTLSLFERSVTN